MHRRRQNLDHQVAGVAPLAGEVPADLFARLGTDIASFPTTVPQAKRPRWLIRLTLGR